MHSNTQTVTKALRFFVIEIVVLSSKINMNMGSIRKDNAEDKKKNSDKEKQNFFLHAIKQSTIVQFV